MIKEENFFKNGKGRKKKAEKGTDKDEGNRSVSARLRASPPLLLLRQRHLESWKESVHVHVHSPAAARINSSYSAPRAAASPHASSSPKESQAMAAAALRDQLNALLSSMFSTGLVDEQFQQLQMLQDDGGSPGFVAEVVTLFVDDADRIIANLAALLEQPLVDFDKVDALVHQLKGSSASVGAQKVKLTCMQFRQFCEEKSREGCLMALAVVRNEFYDLRNKFHTMLQLEQQIEAYDPKQQ